MEFNRFMSAEYCKYIFKRDLKFKFLNNFCFQYTITDLNLPPWRIDPCQLEARGGTEEVVRLLQGRLRLVWNHGGNISPYKLSLTVLGRGLPCQQTNKHPCLTFGYNVYFFFQII